MMLKELRLTKDLTQLEAAKYLGVSLRTYQNYENDATKQKGMQYDFMVERLRQYGYIDENHGIVSLEHIRDVCLQVLPKYSVSYCYLFGSYAKGKAKEDSDIDILVYTETNGLKFFEMVEELREELKKKVDLLDQRQLVNNFTLVNEILKDGIKIYG